MLIFRATVHELNKVCEICFVGICEFFCLCFRLGPSPRKFLKLSKVPIALLRRLNILLLIYLNSILLMGRMLEEILMSRDKLIFLLQVLGFLIKLKKFSSETVSANKSFMPKNKYLQHEFGPDKEKGIHDNNKYNQ